MATASPSQETLYRLLHDRQWDAVLQLVYTHRAALKEDPLLAHAASTAVEVLSRALDEEGPDALGDALQTLFLLHTGDLYPLPAERFGRVVEALVLRHAADPAAAAGYARHAPDRPACAAVLAAQPAPVPHSFPEQFRLDRTVPDRTVPDRTAPDGAASAVRGLFRSQQERTFFRAVRIVFPTHFAYPNVALSAFVTFDAVADGLSPAERSYFFRAVVDCGVFDPLADYYPVYLFEVDSPYHDADDRRSKDRMKDQILRAAGLSLYRIRPHAQASADAFAALLREALAPDAP